MPLLFEIEISELTPDVIVLQGKHLHTPFQNEAIKYGLLEPVTDTISKFTLGGSSQASYVVALKHPAALGKHFLKTQWEDEIKPTVDMLQEIAPDLIWRHTETK